MNSNCTGAGSICTAPGCCGRLPDSAWRGLPPFASFLGEAAIEDSAEKAGHAWIWIVFLVSAILTAGAVFRIGGRVFRGWGPGEESETGGAEKIEEGPETGDAGDGQHRIPPEMFGPAAVLAMLALAIGMIPGVRQAEQTAATRMADAAGYQAIVLDHASVPVHPAPVEHVFPMSSMMRAIAASVLALALAGFSLSPYWPVKKIHLPSG
jgi:multicomponent Na+:H+ antiporter subunit D